MWEKRDFNLFASTRYQATGKMTTKTFLYLLNGQKRAEQYIVVLKLIKMFSREKWQMFFIVFVVLLS